MVKRYRVMACAPNARSPHVREYTETLAGAAYELGLEIGFQAGDSWPEHEDLWIEELLAGEWVKIDTSRITR